jgi:hypothetical protein
LGLKHDVRVRIGLKVCIPDLRKIIWQKYEGIVLNKNMVDESRLGTGNIHLL